MQDQNKSQNKDEDIPKPPRDKTPQNPDKKEEFGGRGGLDPVRYGDWEVGGKCTDF